MPLHYTNVRTPHYTTHNDSALHVNTKNNDSALFKQTKLLQLVQNLSLLHDKQHRVDMRI